MSRRAGWITGMLVLCALVSSAVAGELALPRVTRTTLENGLRVVVAEDHELSLVEFHAIVGAGAAQDPPGQDGVADLTAAALKRGAAGRSAVAMAEAIDSLGGTIGAAAGTDGTIITGEFLSADFTAGLELLRQVVREPTFARDEIRRVRDEQVAGITAALEEPAAIAERCYAAFVYGRHPYGRSMEGRRATVAELGRGDVRDFYERWYHPNATVLVIVGDVTTEDAIAGVRAAFGSWKPSPGAVAERMPVPARHAARRLLLVDLPDATQTQIRFGNFALRRADPDLVPAQVANAILGGSFSSRLIEQLRIKRSLTYSAWSAFSARMTGGDFRVSTFTKTPTTVETLALALDVTAGLRDGLPAAAELAKVQAYMRGQFVLKLEPPDALAARLAEIEFQGLPRDELERYRSRVASVTPDEAARIAQAHVPPSDTMQIVVAGRASEIRAPLEARFGPALVVRPEACEDPASLAGR